jgi:hypothetical protein
MNLEKFNQGKAIQLQMDANRVIIAELDRIRADSAVLTLSFQSVLGTVVFSDNALNQTYADELRAELSKRNDDLQAEFNDL